MDDNMLSPEDTNKTDCVEKETPGSSYRCDEVMESSGKERHTNSDNDKKQKKISNVTGTKLQKWSDPAGRQRAIIPYTAVSGLKPPHSTLFAKAEPEDFYKLLIPDELFDKIAQKTNRFAEESIARDQKAFSRSQSWQPTNKKEIKKIFGLLMYMGLVHLPKLSHYWCKDTVIGQRFPSKVMSRNRFELILQYLHFSNNDSINPADEISKVRELVDELNDNFKKYYTPHEYLYVNERMVPFKGRPTSPQSNKEDEQKSGIKLLKVCTLPGYTCKLQIYCRRNTETTNNSPTDIILSLCEEFLNKGHSIATDNSFTSLELAYKLLESETHLFGTVRKNRRDLPKKVADEKLDCGEYVAQENEDGVSVLKWRDTREVLMLSTKHSTEFATITKNGESVGKPKVVLDYDRVKVASNMSERMTSYASPLRKTVKWYRKLAIELILNFAVVNAFVLHRQTTKRKMSIVEFRTVLVKYLTACEKYESVDRRPIRHRHELKKKPGKVGSSRRFCTSCYKECVKNFGSKLAKNKCIKVSTYCAQCLNEPHFCLSCFNKEHRFK